jgi:hypothetical protein
MPKLEETEVQAMLKQLSEHFNEPVMPLTKFCSTLTKWARIIEEVNHEHWEDLKKRMPDATPDLLTHHGNEYYLHIGGILTDIYKSDLLGRMFYGGEEPRTEKCPEHKGHWSGIEYISDGNHPSNECPHGCQLTGWLPNKEP